MVDSIKGFAEVNQYTSDILIRLQQSVYTVSKAWFKEMGSSLTAALLFPGVVVNLWLGMSQCAPQWLIPT